MFGQTKPLYDIERKLTYKRHLKRLQEISQQRFRKVSEADSLRHMHDIRNQSARFHTIEQANQLSHRNERIISSIMKIARRKSTSQAYQPSMHYFNNRKRKESERQIARSNFILAERILSKQSAFDPIALKKDIQSYQQVKRRMERNKKASLPQLEELSRVGSGGRSRQRSRMLLEHQQ